MLTEFPPRFGEWPVLPRLLFFTEDGGAVDASVKPTLVIANSDTRAERKARYDQEVELALASKALPGFFDQFEASDGQLLDVAECYVAGVFGNPWPEGLCWPNGVGEWQPCNIAHDLVLAGVALRYEINRCGHIIREQALTQQSRVGAEAQILRCRLRLAEVREIFDAFPREVLALDTSSQLLADLQHC